MKPTDVVDSFRVGDAVTELHADGGIFNYNGSQFYGSAGGSGLVMGLNHAVSVLPTPSGAGYWILGADGGIFTFGDAPYKGNALGIATFACQAVELERNGDGYDIIWTCLAKPAAGVSKHP